jgi:hypothetical protein
LRRSKHTAPGTPEAALQNKSFSALLFTPAFVLYIIWITGSFLHVVFFEADGLYSENIRM